MRNTDHSASLTRATLICSLYGVLRILLNSSIKDTSSLMTFHHIIYVSTISLLTLATSVTGGSVAVFGNRGGGGYGKTSDNWAVLSPGTQIFLMILGVILGLFGLYGLYRFLKWCGIKPRKING
ncbi:uncharacterized protein [Parasteatoda tepidariorum]|uniref:uncharacterized protein n=1 Tax=Parasteatoda tepidariorum TaxID=114398 RepID=UPI00077FC1F3|nr:uncharacterized protein LOC107454030 [Parasteatoda tepidariorum]